MTKEEYKAFVETQCAYYEKLIRGLDAFTKMKRFGDKSQRAFNDEMREMDGEYPFLCKSSDIWNITLYRLQNSREDVERQYPPMRIRTEVSFYNKEQAESYAKEFTERISGLRASVPVFDKAKKKFTRGLALLDEARAMFPRGVRNSIKDRL